MLVPLISLALLKEPLRVFTGVGVSVAAGGLYLLTAAGDVPFNEGDLLTLIGAVGFALHLIYTEKLARHHEALKLTLIQLTAFLVLNERLPAAAGIGALIIINGIIISELPLGAQTKMLSAKGKS